MSRLTKDVGPSLVWVLRDSRTECLDENFSKCSSDEGSLRTPWRRIKTCGYLVRSGVTRIRTTLLVQRWVCSSLLFDTRESVNMLIHSVHQGCLSLPKRFAVSKDSVISVCELAGPPGNNFARLFRKQFTL